MYATILSISLHCSESVATFSVFMLIQTEQLKNTSYEIVMKDNNKTQCVDKSVLYQGQRKRQTIK